MHIHNTRKNVSGDYTLIDLERTHMSLFELLGRIDQFRQSGRYSDCEIMLTGNSIVARRYR